MKKELEKPVMIEEGAMEVQNEEVIAYSFNDECGWGITCGAEWQEVHIYQAEKIFLLGKLLYRKEE